MTRNDLVYELCNLTSFQLAEAPEDVQWAIYETNLRAYSRLSKSALIERLICLYIHLSESEGGVDAGGGPQTLPAQEWLHFGYDFVVPGATACRREGREDLIRALLRYRWN